MTRERAPYRQAIDLDELSAADWKHYAHACGRALALAHARSDEAGKIDYDVEPHILDALQPFPLFMDDITEFACDAAKRVRADHRHYRRDHALGAFEVLPKHYR